MNRNVFLKKSGGGKIQGSAKKPSSNLVCQEHLGLCIDLFSTGVSDNAVF